MQAHDDVQGARTQLQLASKALPSFIDRFFIFQAQTLTKDRRGDDSRGVSLMDYIEFQRCVWCLKKAHACKDKHCCIVQADNR